MDNTYLLTIENTNETLTGYLTLIQNNTETPNEDTTEDISKIKAGNPFNPLTILGDLLFIANNMNFPINKPPMESINSTIFFESPYPIETCFNINVEHDYQYFSLLNELKKIITDDQKLSHIQVHNLGIYCKLAPNYHFSYQDEKQQSADFTTYTPMVFGFGSINDMPTIAEKNHLYTCSCNSISEIVFSIFNYLMLLDYHFYKCQHCKKYSAIKRKQGVPKYCNRLNMLGLTGIYESLSCNDSIPKLLDCIRKNKKKSYNYIYSNCGKYLNDFVNGYNDINDLVKSNPSAENLLKLKQYVKDNSIKKYKKICNAKEWE